MPFAAEETGSHAEDTRSSALRCGSSPNLGSRFPDFRFPYPPYDIQIKFMRHMYHALDTSVVGGARVAVMESPTGTGKSLSIICAALSWVREAKAQLARQQEAASSVHTLTTEAEPDWITMFDPQQLAQDNKDHRKQQRKDKLDKRVARRLTNGSSAPLIRPEDEFLLGSSAEVCGYSSTSSDSGGSSEEEDEGEEGRPQVLFSSRTHSQLAQFAREINKTSWHGSVCVATLGSRKNYCLNDTVRRLGSVSLMNEKCNDLRQQKSVKSQRSSIGTSAAKEPKKTCRCTYANPGSIAMFKQACASSDKIMDMEDLVGLGKQLHACPYYGSRAVAKDADVVALPYNMLFQPQTRKSLGVKLRGRVVVVDEAHNLNDAINSMCSVNVSSDQLETALSQLQQYQHRYASRLLADNLQRINQTLRVLRSLGGVLSRAIAMTVQGHVGVAAGAGTLRSNNGFGRIVGVNEFLFETGLDNLNLFELLAFISDSKLAQKLNGFVQFAADEMARKIPCASAKAPPQPPQQQPRLGAMHAAVDFLRALTHANAEVFPGISLQEELRPWSFRCGHVINTRAQLRCIALTHGPSGRELDFRASARALPDSMDELGRVLRNVCASVRGGVVVFFPSYVYEAQCYARWLETGLWSRLQQLRPGLARPLQPPLAAAAATSLVSGVFREADLVNAAVGGGNKKDMKENSVEGLLNRYAGTVLHCAAYFHAFPHCM
jgi:chromosome transmission fidelity protein 1